MGAHRNHLRVHRENVAAGLIGGAGVRIDDRGNQVGAGAHTPRTTWGPQTTGVTGPDNDPSADRRPTVHVSIYGPRGELLKRVAVNEDEVNTLFGEPFNDPDAT